MKTQVIVCAGVGGVGKTSLSAALALKYAHEGARAVVLTIDPAMRLADALGLETLSNQPVPIQLTNAKGSLHALMLDRKATWDEVVTRFSPSPEQAEAVLNNRYYRAVSTRLTGSHEYMATEKLYQLVHAGRWDVVVLDTPPSQQALDFFSAPARIRALFDGHLFKALIAPSRGFFAGATRRIAGVLGHLAGENVMEDIGEFFSLFSIMAAGFRERSESVQHLLENGQTRFFLVTTAADPCRADVLDFVRALREKRLPFIGFLINRAHPAMTHAEHATAPNPSAPPDLLAFNNWNEWRTLLNTLANEQLAEQQNQTNELASLYALNERVWLIPESADGLASIRSLNQLSPFLPRLESTGNGPT